MAYNLSSIKRTDKFRPPFITLYGTPGIGKTTLAASAPAPVFIQTEQGEGTLSIDAFPMPNVFNDVLNCISSLIKEDHEFKTLVIDSADHLEPMIWDAVCREHNVKNITELDFGRGYAYAMDKWRDLIDALMMLREQKGMMILILAHHKSVTHKDPTLEAFDKTDLKLNKNASALLLDLSDAVLFAKHSVKVVREDAGFGGTRARGVSTGKRVIQTTETAGAVAKNRFGLPPELELSWPALQDAIASSTVETK